MKNTEKLRDFESKIDVHGTGDSGEDLRFTVLCVNDLKCGKNRSALNFKPQLLSRAATTNIIRISYNIFHLSSLPYIGENNDRILMIYTVKEREKEWDHFIRVELQAQERGIDVYFEGAKRP